MQESNFEAGRRILEDLAAELRESLNQLDTSPVSPDNAIGRLTRMDAMQSQQLAQEVSRRQNARLREVEEALRRLDRGEYGLCIKCGEEISPARLKVRPEARLCVACASGSAV